MGTRLHLIPFSLVTSLVYVTLSATTVWAAASVKPVKPTTKANAKVVAASTAHSAATENVTPNKSVVFVPSKHPPASAPSLSWDEAVKLARQQNSDIHAADASVEQSDALVKSAWSGYLPTVSATAAISKSNTNGQADPDTDQARLNFSENLFNGFGDQARIEQARRTREATEATRDLAYAQVSASLKTAYQNLLIAENNVALSDDIIERRKRNLDLVELNFEGGRENKGSVLLSQANLDQAELERLQAANSVETSRAALARAIGVDVLPYSNVSSRVPVSEPPQQVDFESLAAQAPELRQAVSSARAAEQAIRVARSAYFPKLDLTGSAGRYGSSWFPETNQGVISLGLTIPLFEGGRSFYGVRAAQAAATNAEAASQTALRAKMVSLRNAYNNYVEAVQRETVTQNFVKAAEIRAEIGRSKYNTGLLSFEEWDLIESDLVTRQRAALTSQNDRVAAEAAWEQAQGRGVLR